MWYNDYENSMTRVRNIKLEPLVISLDSYVSDIILAYNHMIMNNILDDVLNNLALPVHQDQCIL